MPKHLTAPTLTDSDQAAIREKLGAEVGGRLLAFLGSLILHSHVGELFDRLAVIDDRLAQRPLPSKPQSLIEDDKRAIKNAFGQTQGLRIIGYMEGLTPQTAEMVVDLQARVDAMEKKIAGFGVQLEGITATIAVAAKEAAVQAGFANVDARLAAIDEAIKALQGGAEPSAEDTAEAANVEAPAVDDSDNPGPEGEQGEPGRPAPETTA